ncbi:uncharacterized protein LOC128919710 [Zeugodacus cucurbitae]|uniref:Transcription factor Adf-1 n=1 Tax=Zeugodacus cucurbitae TaxID=28588 RepID=A0A0A1XKF5_ZEUCU|nr:uncharacterized protein LOC128919710 [Zeugodacus cucurbitae]
MPAKNANGKPKTGAVTSRSCKIQNRKNVVENKKLICSVKRFPQLYNSDHKDYLQQKATNEAWKAVAESWGKSARFSKVRWRNLRAAYARSINVYKTQRGPNRGKSYYLTKEMEFLRPYLQKEVAAVVGDNIADNAAEVVRVLESDALEPSTSRSNHSTVRENENPNYDHFIQNIQRQMQSMNQSQNKTFIEDFLKKIVFPFVIDTMEEQEFSVLQRKIQDRLNQCDDTQNDEVLVKNEPLSPDSDHPL